MQRSTPALAPLEMIGFWKGRLADPYPLPMELPSLGYSEIEAIADYLEAGNVAEQWRGLSWCRYGCEGHFGSKDLSDGVWLWPEGLAHYIRLHRVALPPAFVEHALGNTIALRIDADTLRARTRSDDVWVAWSAPLRTRQIEDRLRLAELEAVKRCDRALAESADQLSRRRGLSQSLCISIACGRLAVAGIAICAKCAAEEWRAMEQNRSEYHLLVQLAAELRMG